MINNWRDLAVTYGSQCLFVGGIPVVGQEEGPLQEFLVATTINIGEGLVIEIGFGLGLASYAISRRRPIRHVIVEANAELARQASEKFRLAEVVNDRWENFISSAREKECCIVYDPSPDVEDEIGSTDFALAHLSPIWKSILPVLKTGSRVGCIDPSGQLESAFIKKEVAHNVQITIKDVPKELIPPDLPWFRTGCSIVTFVIG